MYICINILYHIYMYTYIYTYSRNLFGGSFFNLQQANLPEHAEEGQEVGQKGRWPWREEGAGRRTQQPQQGDRAAGAQATWHSESPRPAPSGTEGPSSARHGTARYTRLKQGVLDNVSYRERRGG